MPHRRAVAMAEKKPEAKPKPKRIEAPAGPYVSKKEKK